MDMTRPADRLFDYDVVDSEGRKIGSVNNVWVDQETSAPKFLGAQAGWLLTHTYVVPATAAQIDDEARVVRLPFDEEFVKHAPALSSGALLTDDDQRKIFGYYGGAPGAAATSPGFAESAVASDADRVAGYAQNEAAAASRKTVGVADRVEEFAQETAATGYDRVPTNPVDTNAAPAAAPMAAAPTAAAPMAAAQNTVQAPVGRAPEFDRSAQVDRQPVETVEAGPVSNQDAGMSGEIQIRKVVRRERIYVPVDVDREYVEVTPASAQAANVAEGSTSAPSNASSQPPPVSDATASANTNEVARSSDNAPVRADRPRSA